MDRLTSLKRRLLQNVPVFGMFTRLADPEAVEALAASALDFVVLDVEHGSLDRGDINRIVAAASARDLPVIVRVPGAVPSDIHHALAVGAAGIVVPHVGSGAEARAVADFVRSDALQRAYAGMGRAADYRRPGWQAFRQAMHDRFVVVAQIDDAAGAAAADEIAQVPGLDVVFVGSLSLALSLDEADPASPADLDPASLANPGPASPAVDQTIAGICQACARADRRIGIHVLDAAARQRWADRGVNFFVIGNDLNLLRQGADAAVGAFRADHSLRGGAGQPAP